MMIVVIMIVVETTPGVENILPDVRMMIADAVLDEFLLPLNVTEMYCL